MAGLRSKQPGWRYRACYAETENRAVIYQKKIEAARGRNRRISFAGELLATALCVWLLFGVFFGLAVVRGDSMLPGCRDGDLLFISRCSQASAGDIVLFRYEGVEYVKRVVAVCGDEVDLNESSGVVVVNGVPLQEKYAVSPTLPRSGGLEFPIKLGKDEFFVLGDNRPVSQDSRVIGTISEDQIDGKVLAQLRLNLS